MTKKIFIIDIDGTVCEDVANEEGLERMANAKPYPDVIKQIRRWFDEGHYICFFTSRTIEHKSVTEEWLKRNDVRYNQIVYGKPRRNSEFVEYHFIDNSRVRATTFTGKVGEFVTKTRQVLVFPDD